MKLMPDEDGIERIDTCNLLPPRARTKWNLSCCYFQRENFLRKFGKSNCFLVSVEEEERNL